MKKALEISTGVVHMTHLPISKRQFIKWLKADPARRCRFGEGCPVAQACFELTGERVTNSVLLIYCPDKWVKDVIEVIDTKIGTWQPTRGRVLKELTAAGVING